jgi:hypothetical protein
MVATALQIDVDLYSIQAGKVSSMTMDVSKGLEFSIQMFQWKINDEFFQVWRCDHRLVCRFYLS